MKSGRRATNRWLGLALGVALCGWGGNAWARPWTTAPTTEPSTAPATGPAGDSGGTTPIAPPPPAADTPIGPTSSFADLEAGVAQKKYRQVLVAVSRTLSLPESQKPTFDKYPYLMLRAECLLQLKNASAAETTLEQAAKATPNQDEKARATALDLLIKRSYGFKYMPQHTDDKTLKRGVDILDKTQRQKAYALLLDDEMAAVSLPVKQALVSPSLPPILDVAERIAPLPAVEFAATGKRDRTTAAYTELYKHAEDLMTKSLTAMSDSRQRIAQNADRMVPITINMANGTTMQQNRRRGLAGSDRDSLLSIANTCNKLAPWARELQETLQLEGDPFKSILDKAKTLHDEALQTLAKG